MSRRAALLPALTLLVWLGAGALPAVAQTASPTTTPSASPTAEPSLSPTSGECVVCHALPEVVETDQGIRQGLFVTKATIHDSVHRGMTCSDCHSPLTATGHPADDRAATACADCHEAEGKEWAAGAHGRPSDLGVPPTCVTCHGNHDVERVATPGFKEEVAVKCADCHREVSKHQFGSNPLGMETHLGRMDLATCDDCHEPHEVLPPSDPRSSVSAQNKLQTCQQCHTNAPPNFKDIEVHVASGPLPSDTKLRLATLWMLGILIFTFAFFGWLTVLGIRYEWRHGRGRRTAAEEGER